ncbi:SPOR domain-containing protein [Flavobacterium sp. NRK1]|uniref:SPOR domain-containing protein n=1 Tax=Flavobacterium sp. NRK1 TaxID=2954929 RepID=UPI0020935731|nr:SPOR domain-containing protein [Flavobacterium sp. NRK1]MCO6148073.1 SPOR domain-containing protein [Flavobacterium sp. NRK1]
MRILNLKPYKTVFLLLTIWGSNCIAQEGKVSVSQDARFEQLLKEKRKINPSITINDRYKIQIFYGDNEKARKSLSEFKREFKSIDGTIIYESPTYKVWVGNFKSRLDAERSLQEIKKKYPYALLIKQK